MSKFAHAYIRTYVHGHIHTYILYACPHKYHYAVSVFLHQQTTWSNHREYAGVLAFPGCHFEGQYFRLHRTSPAPSAARFPSFLVRHCIPVRWLFHSMSKVPAALFWRFPRAACRRSSCRREKFNWSLCCLVKVNHKIRATITVFDFLNPRVPAAKDFPKEAFLNLENLFPDKKKTANLSST